MRKPLTIAAAILALIFLCGSVMSLGSVGFGSVMYLGSVGFPPVVADYTTVSGGCSIAAGSSSVTSPSSGFTATQNGLTIVINGAGATGADLEAVFTFVSASSGTVSVAAGTAVTAATCGIGTNNTPLLQNALTACESATTASIAHRGAVLSIGGDSSHEYLLAGTAGVQLGNPATKVTTGSATAPSCGLRGAGTTQTRFAIGPNMSGYVFQRNNMVGNEVGGFATYAAGTSYASGVLDTSSLASGIPQLNHIHDIFVYGTNSSTLPMFKIGNQNSELNNLRDDGRSCTGTACVSFDFSSAGGPLYAHDISAFYLTKVGSQNVGITNSLIMGGLYVGGTDRNYLTLTHTQILDPTTRANALNANSMIFADPAVVGIIGAGGLSCADCFIVTSAATTTSILAGKWQNGGVFSGGFELHNETTAAATPFFGTMTLGSSGVATWRFDQYTYSIAPVGQRYTNVLNALSSAVRWQVTSSYQFFNGGNATILSDANFSVPYGPINGGSTLSCLNQLPGTTGSATDYCGRSLDNAGSRSLDSGISNSGAWIQSRDKNSYAVDYPLLLNPNGLGVQVCSTTFANLATVLPTNGLQCYCSDCTIANPCAGAGTGAIAKRLNAINVCN